MENIISFRPNKTRPVKFGELLRLYRGRGHLTQKALALRLNLQSDRMVKKWESGESLPEPARLQKLVEIFLREGIFTLDHEKSEVRELWAVVKRTFELQSLSFETYNIFDDRWFDRLINDINAPSPPTSSSASPKQLNLPAQPARDQLAASHSSSLSSLSYSSYPARHNLLPQTRALIGREKDCEQVKSLLEKGRLLTLTGVAGVGKSRLALEIAGTLVTNFKDGVWLLNLSGETGLTFEGLLQKLANLTGQAGKVETPGSSMTKGLPPLLEMLVVLDDCDPVIEEARPIFNRLLKSWPGLKILVTSRESLNILGENIYRLRRLGLAEKQSEEVGSKSISPVVQLFIERAELSLPGFKLALTPTKEELITQICQKLDNVPLAVELAARLVEGLSLKQIEARLEEPFNLLKMKQKRLRDNSFLPDDRSFSLKTSLDLSYNRLNPAEKVLLNNLARIDNVTQSFSLEQVEQLYTENGEDAGLVMDILYSLLRKSLVEVKTAKENRPIEFFLLNIVRKYLIHRHNQDEKEKR